MSGIISNKVVSLLVLPLVLCAAAGQGTGSSLVLCIGQGEHLAIETDQACVKGYVRDLGPTRPDSLFSSPDGTSLHRARGSCLDIPLLLGRPGPNLSSGHYSNALRNMIVRASASAAARPAPDRPGRFSPRRPWSHPHGSSLLRSTVLLI